jgi:hypothetical protein
MEGSGGVSLEPCVHKTPLKRGEARYTRYGGASGMWELEVGLGWGFDVDCCQAMNFDSTVCPTPAGFKQFNDQHCCPSEDPPLDLRYSTTPPLDSEARPGGGRRLTSREVLTMAVPKLILSIFPLVQDRRRRHGRRSSRLGCWALYRAIGERVTEFRGQ